MDTTNLFPSELLSWLQFFYSKTKKTWLHGGIFIGHSSWSIHWKLKPTKKTKFNQKSKNNYFRPNEKKDNSPNSPGLIVVNPSPVFSKKRNSLCLDPESCRKSKLKLALFSLPGLARSPVAVWGCCPGLKNREVGWVEKTGWFSLGWVGHWAMSCSAIVLGHVTSADRLVSLLSKRLVVQIIYWTWVWSPTLLRNLNI